MSWLALSASLKYLCYGSTAIRKILLFQREDRLYTSQSDVYRRQILTYKDGLRAERVNDDWILAINHISYGGASLLVR